MLSVRQKQRSKRCKDNDGFDKDDDDDDNDILGSCMKTPTSSACTSTDFGATDTLPDLMVGQYKDDNDDDQ